MCLRAYMYVCLLVKVCVYYMQPERRGGQTFDPRLYSIRSMMAGAAAAPCAASQPVSPVVKSASLIKPTVRRARAHKRDDESGGTEWALMVIGIELAGVKAWDLHTERERLTACTRLSRDRLERAGAHI